MECTVENSEWHREKSVAAHTMMCVEFYGQNIARLRSPRQQLMTLVSLLFHDFGKPEAEEVLTNEQGETRRRYAGHEQVSANEFMNFMVDHPQIRKFLAAAGLNDSDLVRIKLMIEQHLPFGIKNPTKRSNLKTVLSTYLGSDIVCFYDQLTADCAGRISDDHDTKIAAVQAWIEEFKAVPLSVMKTPANTAPTVYVLIGPSGIGKSTWTSKLVKMNHGANIRVVSEDEYRLQFARANVPMDELTDEWAELSTAEFYDRAWKFCHLSPASKEYEKFVKERVRLASVGCMNVVIDRTNTSRKNRGKFIEPFRAAGFNVHAVLFLASENLVNARQATRGDKCVPPKSVHQQVMSTEVPWLGVEFHDLEIVSP